MRSANFISQIVQYLLKCRHHDWTMLGSYWMTTAWNGFLNPVEEQCSKCGGYRHLILDHKIAGEEEWRDGRHPQSLKKKEASSE